MDSSQTQTADAQARIILPAAFAEATVVVEVLGPDELRVRKVGEPADEQSLLPENNATMLSDRDRERFLELIASRPTAKCRSTRSNG